MKFINVNEIRGLRKVETSGDFHFIINEEINLYIKEDKITSLVILDKIKPPFDLYFDVEDFIYNNTISSNYDFEIIICSECFGYPSIHKGKTKFALKGKLFGSEKIEKESNFYNVLINQELVASGSIDGCLKFLSIDNNKIGLNNIMNNFIDNQDIKVLK